GLCLVGRRQGWPQRQLLTALLTLACCWMTALGPATESATYVLLAPVLSWAVLEAWAGGSLAARVILGTSYLLMLGCAVAGWFPEGGAVRGLGVQALAALLLFGQVFVWGLYAAWRRRPVGEPPRLSVAAA